MHHHPDRCTYVNFCLLLASLLLEASLLLLALRLFDPPAAAGGPSATARLRRAWLLRGDERIPINIRAVLRGKEADRQIQAEDQLIIDESPI